MAATIYKYTLAITDSVSIDMPKDAIVLCVQVQHEALCVWAKVHQRCRQRGVQDLRR